MKVTIFGSGYVGLVTGACLADAGNDVLCVDIDPERIERLTGATFRSTNRGWKRWFAAIPRPDGSNL